LKKNYQRPHITALFEELQRRGFGVYTPGARGKGKCARFMPNNTCPVKYTVLVDASKKSAAPEPSTASVQSPAPPPLVRPTPPPIQAKPAVAAPKVVEESPASNEQATSSVAVVGNWLRGLSQIVVRDATSSVLGYECVVFCDEILALCRIRGGGEPTIEEALQAVWNKVKDRVGYKHTTKAGMTPFELVESRLKGLGYYILDRPANMGYG